jgi:hypothetical protein
MRLSGSIDSLFWSFDPAYPCGYPEFVATEHENAVFRPIQRLDRFKIESACSGVSRSGLHPAKKPRMQS